jgi:hypothetical protein
MGRPHLWVIEETLDEFEYWQDRAYPVRILWKDNEIYAWDDDRKKSILRNSDIEYKGGVMLMDKHHFNVDKYIWK